MNIRKLCVINPDGSLGPCLFAPGGGHVIPGLPGHGTTTTTTTSPTGPDNGPTGPPKGPGQIIPFKSDYVLSDLSLISSIEHASSSIADEGARTEVTEAIERAIQKLDEKAKKHGFTIRTVS